MARAKINMISKKNHATMMVLNIFALFLQVINFLGFNATLAIRNKSNKCCSFAIAGGTEY